MNLRRSLAKTQERLAGALRRLLPGGAPDAGALEALEEALIAADVGPETADELVEALRRPAQEGEPEDPRARLRAAMLRVLVDAGAGSEPVGGTDDPWVGLVVGVNGSGKTTTAAKLAARLRHRKMEVILGAADTFRAAAIDQLVTWGERIGVPVVAHRPGGDPAAVAYDTCESARSRGLDAVIIDTAGRLHTQPNLMAELDKVRRVTGNVIDGAPHDVYLVLDATTGQNGLRQAEEFLGHVGVTGLILAKLDGTARGGVALTIARRLELPIRYVGTGEGADDLSPFDDEAYVDGLLGS